ncbi:hypothetical protein MRX96_042844 [Rhipicephalus microplus]
MRCTPSACVFAGHASPHDYAVCQGRGRAVNRWETGLNRSSRPVPPVSAEGRHLTEHLILTPPWRWYRESFNAPVSSACAASVDAFGGGVSKRRSAEPLPHFRTDFLSAPAKTELKLLRCLVLARPCGERNSALISTPGVGTTVASSILHGGACVEREGKGAVFAPLGVPSRRLRLRSVYAVVPASGEYQKKGLAGDASSDRRRQVLLAAGAAAGIGVTQHVRSFDR